ncbi:30S ribosomal protein S19e, partial [Candidatus Woesearchaeota archaeon]|nr:30S ribosomal protein S19e [Candidatus Woesearchaeota archaeon]
MPTINDVPVNDLIEEVSKDLQKVDEVRPPEWSEYVKTGTHKERPPAREDWWFVRCAAVLRSVRKLGPVGVNKLRTKYGGKKNRGHKKERFYKGSGNVLRKCLQQLEAAGLIKKGEAGGRKGRIATPKGISLLDKASVRLYVPIAKRPKPESVKQTEEKKEVPKKDIPASKVEKPVNKAIKPSEKPAVKVEKPAVKVEKPAEKVEKPAEKVEKPAEKVEKPEDKTETPS